MKFKYIARKDNRVLDMLRQTRYNDDKDVGITFYYTTLPITKRLGQCL